MLVISTGRSDKTDGWDGRGIEWLNKIQIRLETHLCDFAEGGKMGVVKRERKQWTSDSLVDDVVFSRHPLKGRPPALTKNSLGGGVLVR